MPTPRLDSEQLPSATLSLAAGELSREHASRVFALELDTRRGELHTFGVADVHCGGDPELTLRCADRPERYRDPRLLAGVELWRAPHSVLAIFASQPALRAGARALAAAFADGLSAQLANVLQEAVDRDLRRNALSSHGEPPARLQRREIAGHCHFDAGSFSRFAAANAHRYTQHD